MRLSSFALFLSAAAATPHYGPQKISALECKIINVVVAKLKVAPSATKYCSSVLKISTQTFSSTKTVTSTAVVVAPTTTVAYTTSIQTSFVTSTTGTSTVTADTSTVTVTLTTETTVCDSAPTPSPIKARNVADLEARHRPKCAGAPRGLQDFACEKVTKACKCLNIPTPKTTKVKTVTRVPTRTSVSIATNTITRTNTITQTQNTFAVTTYTPTTTTTTYQTSTVISCPEEACPTPSSVCNDVCQPPSAYDSDPNNCGACGNVCPQGCQNGRCVNPSCAGQTCDTFTACGPGGSCVCASVAGGAGLCADGQTPCAGLADCNTNADCPLNFSCAVGTCCSRNVCIATNDVCQNTALPRALFKRKGSSRVKGVTVGGF